MEIWKDIEGFEGRYQVSNFGNVKSLGCKRNGKKEKILKQHYDKRGYKKVTLSKNYELKSFSVHRLVAIAFLENLENKRTVNHINGIKHDNRVENLEWCTDSENTKHAFKLGLKTPPLKGKTGINDKRSKKILQLDKTTLQIIDVFYGFRDIERKKGYKISPILCCCKKRSRTAYGYAWCYEDEYSKMSLDDTIKKVKKIKVMQFTKKMEYIATYDSIASACELLKIKNRSNISRCCKGQRKSASGYIWKYAERSDDLSHNKLLQ